MTNTRDYIVFDRTGTPHAVVAIKVEIGRGTPPEPCPECGASLEFESDENTCCWCCPNCCYTRAERELPEVEG